MNKTNIRVRRALARNMMFNYQLAEILEISEATLCRKLRKELPEEEQDEMVRLIELYATGDGIG